MPYTYNIRLVSDFEYEQLESVFKQFCGWSGLICGVVDDPEQANLFIVYGYSGSIDRYLVFGRPVLIIPNDKYFDINSEPTYGYHQKGLVTNFSYDIVKRVTFFHSYCLERGTTSYGNYLDEDIFNKNSLWFKSPTLNISFKELEDALLESTDDWFLFRNAHPNNARFSLCLTHDVDYFELNLAARLKLIRNAYKVIKSGYGKIASIGGLLKYCLNSNKIDLELSKNIEKLYGVGATYNFSAYINKKADSLKTKLLNPSYSLAEVEDDDLLDKYFETALHGSTAAFFDPIRYREEVNLLSSRIDLLGGRQHMLACQFPITFNIFDEIGFKYDTSMGFNDINGYRASSAMVHKPYKSHSMDNYSFYEIPLLFMDSVFTKRGVVDTEVIKGEVLEFAQLAKNFSISGSLCWHDVAFRSGSKMLEAYEMLIDIFKDSGGYLCSVKELVKFLEGVDSLSYDLDHGVLKITSDILGSEQLYIERRNRALQVESIKCDTTTTISTHSYYLPVSS